MTGHDLELNESVPDLVVERGGPAPVPPSGPPASVQPRWMGSATLAILVGPVAIAYVVRLVTSHDQWLPIWQLWIVALIAFFAASRFLERGERMRVTHVAAGYVPLRAFEEEILQTAIAIALAVIAEAALVASLEPWMGVAIFALLVAWVVLCMFPPLRRIEGRRSIQVACSPEAAFALLSDPHSWRLWTPELEVVEPSEVPIRLGTVVHGRMRIGGRQLEGDERVVAFDPPRMCASETLNIRGSGYDSYEMTATEGGTFITYTARFMRPIDRAALGEAFRSGHFLTERWRTKMQRIKQLLEEGSAGSV